MNRSIMRQHGLSLKSTKPYFNNGWPLVNRNSTGAETAIDAAVIQRVATLTLTQVHTAGALASWQNPESYAIIARAFLDITTVCSIASSTIAVGAAADATTLGDNISDGVAATAAALTQGNWVKIAANGGAADWITASRDSGGTGTTMTALEGKLHIIYFKAE